MSSAKKKTRNIKFRTIETPDVSQYRIAMQAPFNPKAEGCRIPDSYSFPTNVTHLRGAVQIQAPPASTTGGVFLAPHPLLGLIDLASWNSGTANVSTTSMTPYSSNNMFYAPTTPAGLQTQHSMFRVVSVGFRIRNLQPMLTCTGKFFVAPVPITRTWNSVSSMSNVAMATSQSVNYFGCGIAAAYSASILALPGAQEFSCNDLATCDIALSHRPSGPNAFNFHNSLPNSTYNGTNVSGDDSLTVLATGLVNGSSQGWEDQVDASGHVGFLVAWLGVPSAATPLFDIEYVYHLEGMPPISTQGASAVPVPSSGMALSSNREGFDQVMDEMGSLPAIRVVKAGLDLYNNISGGKIRATVKNAALRGFASLG